MLDHIFSRYMSVGDLSTDQTLAGLIAALFTAYWLWSWRLQARSPLPTVLIWFTCAAVLWGTSITLLLPWPQEYNSYRPAIMRMIETAKVNGGAHACVHVYYNAQVSPVFQYLAGAHLPAQHGLGEGCPFTFVMTCQNACLTANSLGPLIWRDPRWFAPCQEFRLYKTD